MSANSAYVPLKDQLSAQSLTPGAYTNPSLTVDQYGRITAVASGAAGAGIPAGGTTGQVLAKNSNASFDLAWTTPSGGGGTVPITQGGTGQITQQLALNAIAGAVTNARFLRGDGTNVTLSAIQASDVPVLNQNTTGSAATAGFATTAGSASTATTAGSASTATSAGSATTATTASNALAINGVTVTGTPTAGQVLTANSSSAATFQTPAGGGGGGTNPPTFQLGTYTTNLSLGQQAYYLLYVATATQAVTKAQVYLPAAQAASVVAVAVYNASGSTQLGTGTATVSTTGLLTVTITSVSMVAGIGYLLALLNQNNETVTRFAAMPASNDANVNSVVNSTSSLPVSVPAVGSRTASGVVPYLLLMS